MGPTNPGLWAAARIFMPGPLQGCHRQSRDWVWASSETWFPHLGAFQGLVWLAVGGPQVLTSQTAICSGGIGQCLIRLCVDYKGDPCRALSGIPTGLVGQHRASSGMWLPQSECIQGPTCPAVQGRQDLTSPPGICICGIWPTHPRLWSRVQEGSCRAHFRDVTDSHATGLG